MGFVTGIYRFLKWRFERNLVETQSRFEHLIQFAVLLGIFTLLTTLTREYVPYGWVIFLINIAAITIYVSWKPYHWHMNNEASVRILKEHGITEPNWWNTRKLFLSRIQFLANEKSIVNFYSRGVDIVYWPSVREIYWYELESDKKMVEYLNIIVSEEDFVGIESKQKNFEKAVETMTRKFPGFADNWEKRRDLPEDEKLGTILYEKYPNKKNA